MALTALLTLCACTAGDKIKDGAVKYDREGYKALFDNALKLPRQFDRKLLDKVSHPNEIEYNINSYNERGQDYIALLQTEFDGIGKDYTERYGDDWKLSYTVDSVDEKNAEGIENYKKFDSYFFKTYNINTDDIQAVTFVKVTVHIEGSLGSNDKQKTVQCFCIGGEWYSFYAIRLGIKM